MPSGFRDLIASLKGTSPGEMAAPRPGPGIVAIADFKFGPETVAVAPNTPITWHNADGSPHQVTITGAKPQRASDPERADGTTLVRRARHL